MSWYTELGPSPQVRMSVDIPASVQNPSECNTEPSTVRNRVRRSAGDVQTFLESINPSMAQFTALFIRAGVIDADHLKALVDLPDDEQSGFLRDDLNLNALEVRLIGVALHARKE